MRTTEGPLLRLLSAEFMVDLSNGLAMLHNTYSHLNYSLQSNSKVNILLSNH